MAQYKKGSRTSKPALMEQLANELDGSTKTLNIPNIDSYTGPMHTQFALEDFYGIMIDRIV